PSAQAGTSNAESVQLQRVQQNDFWGALRTGVHGNFCGRVAQSGAAFSTCDLAGGASDCTSLYFWDQRNPGFCIARFRGFDRANPTGAASGIRGHERGANHSAGSDTPPPYELSGEL